MLKRAALLVMMVVATLAADVNAGQERAAPSGIRLRFADDADLTHLSIRYFLTGPFGGLGSQVRIKPGVREYDLPVRQEGQRANTLKAIVYCLGYQTVLVTETGFGDGPPRTISIHLEPLASRSLQGQIRGVSPGERLTIEVLYLAVWDHPFFGILDGMVSQFVVASTPLQANGSFVVEVPDFMHDPVVSKYEAGARGYFRLIARDPDTGNIPYVLHVSNDAATPAGGVPIADAYPETLAVTALPR